MQGPAGSWNVCSSRRRIDHSSSSVDLTAHARAGLQARDSARGRRARSRVCHLRPMRLGRCAATWGRCLVCRPCAPRCCVRRFASLTTVGARGSQPSAAHLVSCICRCATRIGIPLCGSRPPADEPRYRGCIVVCRFRSVAKEASEADNVGANCSLNHCRRQERASQAVRSRNLS